MGEGKGHHLDMPMAILQKVVLGNTRVQEGLPDMEEVRLRRVMEGDLLRGRHLHLEDTADSLLGRHPHREDMEDNLPGLHPHLEYMGDNPPGLRRHLEAIGLHLEVMEQTRCRLAIMRMRDRKPRQINKQYNLTETSLLHLCHFSIPVKVR